MNALRTKALSIGLRGIAAVSLLMTGGQAQAQGTCPADTSISTVLAAGFSCTLGPLLPISPGAETFSNFAITGAPTDARVQFGQLGDLFAVTLSRDGGFFLPQGGRVVLDFTTAPVGPHTIVMGTVGVDVSFPKIVTTTLMNGLFLTPPTIENGGTSMITFSPGVDSVVVDNSLKIETGSAELNSISNDFSQVMIGVPEPISLSLFGLGLLGLGFARRRLS
jgi:hypothetical protein